VTVGVSVKKMAVGVSEQNDDRRCASNTLGLPLI